MSLRKEVVIDKIEILEDSTLQLRQSTRIFDNDILIAEQYHRSVAVPDSDPEVLPSRVRAIAKLLWTPEEIEKYRERKLRDLVKGRP